MIPKTASRREIDKFVTMQIKKSDKAPRNWAQKREAMRRAGTDIAVDLEKQGTKLPWGIFFIIGAFAVAIILFVFLKVKRGEDKGEGFDQPVDIRGKDADTLLGEFGHSKPGEKGQPGRPFDES